MLFINRLQTGQHSKRYNLTPFFWLIIGELGIAGMYWRSPIALAAWIAPLCIMRFFRTSKLTVSLIVAYVATYTTIFLTAQGMLNVQGILYALVIAFLTAMVLLPFFIDAWLVKRHKGLVATLIFPLSVVTIEYALALFSPYGTWSSFAYSQYGNLPLLQLVSITGIWGVSFLIAWFASIVNWVWQYHFKLQKGMKLGIVLYTSVMIVVLIFGFARLYFFSPRASTPTVRVATIQASQQAVARSQTLFSTLIASSHTGKQPYARAYAASAAPTNSSLLAETEQAAQSGAKIIVWNESAALLLNGDATHLVAQVAAIAEKYGAYIDIGVDGVIGANNARTILVDPSGKVVWQYYKIRLMPGDQAAPGTNAIPVVTTPYGKLANIICFDADFPTTVWQVNRTRADIMLIPAGDWREIDPYHTQMAVFRGLENGFSVVRSTYRGLSLATDYEGHVLGERDYFSNSDRVMIADVPTRGVVTLYSSIGDAFALVCMGSLVMMLVLGYKDWLRTILGRRPTLRERKS